jgi:hypothetical protein
LRRLTRFMDFHFTVFCYSRVKSRRRGTAMSFAMYILIGIIIVAAIYFVIKGKKS